jgi:hypothetical protein
MAFATQIQRARLVLTDSRGEGGLWVTPRATGADGATDEAIQFLREMRQMRSGAGLGCADLAARAHYPKDVIMAAEAGPSLPDLPILSAYVRGCGGTVAEWEERWRALTGTPITSPGLPARPVGGSSLAAAGARAASSTPAVGIPDQRRIMAAISRASAAWAATAAIPPQTRTALAAAPAPVAPVAPASLRAAPGVPASRPAVLPVTAAAYQPPASPAPGPPAPGPQAPGPQAPGPQAPGPQAPAARRQPPVSPALGSESPTLPPPAAPVSPALGSQAPVPVTSAPEVLAVTRAPLPQTRAEAMPPLPATRAEIMPLPATRAEVTMTPRSAPATTPLGPARSNSPSRALMRASPAPVARAPQLATPPAPPGAARLTGLAPGPGPAPGVAPAPPTGPASGPGPAAGAIGRQEGNAATQPSRTIVTMRWPSTSRAGRQPTILHVTIGAVAAAVMFLVGAIIVLLLRRG